MAESPWFEKVLAEVRDLHERKNHDYAENGDPFSNFRFAAQMAGTDPHTVLTALIGIKTARINELTAAGKTPNNESERDSRLDRAVYALIDVALYDQEWEQERGIFAPPVCEDFAATLSRIDDLTGAKPAAPEEEWLPQHRVTLNPHIDKGREWGVGPHH